MVILLDRVKLLNFLSHKDTEIVFERGVTVFIGPNGSGKTSVIDAIYFALTGNSPRGKLEDLINERAQRAVIELSLIVNGNRLFIRRTLDKRSKFHEAEVRLNGRLEALGVKKVNEYLNKIFGFDLDLLDKTVIARQGELTKLIDLRPAERQKKLDELLGLEDYRIAYEKLRDQSIKVKSADILGIKYTVKELSEVKRDYEKIKEELKIKKKEFEKNKVEKLRLEGEYNKVLKELENSEKRKREIESKLEILESLKEEYLELERKLKSLREYKNMLESELQDVNRKLEEASLIKERSEKLRIWAEMSSKIREMVDLFKKKEDLKYKIKELEEEIIEYEGELNRLNELKKYYEEYNKIKLEIEKLNKKLRELERYSGRLETLEADLKRKLEEKKRYEEDMSKLLNDIKERGIEVEEDRILDILEEKRHVISDEIRELENEISSLRERRGAIKNIIDDCESKIKLLKSAEGAKCPLCNQPLTDNHRRRIIGELMDKKDHVVEELNTLEDALRSFELEVERIKKSLDFIDESLERIKGLKEQMVQLDEEISDIKIEIQGIKALLEEINNIKSKFKKLEDHKENIEHLYEDYIAVKGRVESVDINEYKAELDEKITSLKSIEEKIKELEVRIRERLGITIKTLNEAEEALKRADEYIKELGEAERRIGEIAQLEFQLKELTNKLLKVNDEITEVEDRIRDPNFQNIENKIKNNKKELEEIEEIIRECREKKGLLEGGINSLEDKQKTLMDDIKRSEFLLEELKDIIYKLTVLNYIREEVFKYDKFPAILRDINLRLIERYMGEYLEAFNLPYTDVRVEKNFDIQVVGPGIRRGLNKLSGGEKVVVAIASIMALNRAVTRGKLGFMIMDEPTIHLDSERRRQLIEVVSQFKGGEIIPQLIVVTHDPEVQYAADYIYEFELIRGYSSVKPI